MSGERNEKGQFVKGNSGGPGRSKRSREERYHEITMTACTFADWQRIVEKAVKQAKNGNQQARFWLAGYLIGPPRQKVDLSGSIGVHDDLAEWKRKRQEQLDAVAEMEEPE